MSPLRGQAGRLLCSLHLGNTERSQEHLAQEGTHRLCPMPRLPAGLLTPQVDLLHLKAASSPRVAPSSPPATDSRPLPARAQLSPECQQVPWAPAEQPQLRSHQTLSRMLSTLCVPSPRIGGRGRTGMDRGRVWTLVGWTVTSDLPDAPQSTPDPSTALLASFPLFQEKPPRPWPPVGSRLCETQDSASPAHPATPFLLAALWGRESLRLESQSTHIFSWCRGPPSSSQ